MNVCQHNPFQRCLEILCLRRQLLEPYYDQSNLSQLTHYKFLHSRRPSLTTSGCFTLAQEYTWTVPPKCHFQSLGFKLTHLKHKNKMLLTLCLKKQRPDSCTCSSQQANLHSHIICVCNGVLPFFLLQINASQLQKSCLDKIFAF